MWENEKSALLKRLETETLILKSEKDAAVKKQEARVKLLNEEVRSLQSELERVRSDFTTQREHLENTQRKMTDLKTKYDIESSSFREERFTLERRAKEVYIQYSFIGFYSDNQPPPQFLLLSKLHTDPSSLCCDMILNIKLFCFPN